jgi:hypothetical protein
MQNAFSFLSNLELLLRFCSPDTETPGALEEAAMALSSVSPAAATGNPGATFPGLDDVVVGCVSGFWIPRIILLPLQFAT